MADLCEKSTNSSLVSKSANFSTDRCNNQLLVSNEDQIKSNDNLHFSSCESTKSSIVNSLNNSSINSSDEDNLDEELIEQSSLIHHSDIDKETNSSDTQLSSRSLDNKSESSCLFLSFLKFILYLRF